MSMLLFISLVVVMAIGATGTIGYLVARSRKRSDGSRALTSDFRPQSRQLETDLGGRALTDLKLNDIIVYYDNDFMVEGRITYSQGGWRWFTYHLEDQDTHRWLGVEQDDGLEVQMWEEVEDFEVDSPPPQVIEYQGETFRRVEKGRAKVQSIGRTGRAVSASVEFYDYNGSKGRYLSVEDWNGDIEVSVGHDVDHHSELSVFPGDQIGA